MKLRVFTIAFFFVCLTHASQSVWAQPYPPGPTTDTTQSLGQFVLVLNPSVSGAFVGVPGYSASDNTFTSPLLYDPSTQINRSMPLVLGNGSGSVAAVGTPISGFVSSNPADSALLFSGNTGVNAGLSYPIPSGTGATSPNTDSVFTQINAFNLNNGGDSRLRPGRPQRTRNCRPAWAR